MTVRLIRATFGITAALLMAASPASAQLGKLRKAAEDKAKEAAGVKKEAPKAADNTPSRDYAISGDRIDLVLKALTQAIAQAERDEAVRKARTDYEAKSKAAQSCLETAGAAKAGAMMVPDPTNVQKASALTIRVGEMSQRASAAQQAKRYREFLALQDTVQVLGMQSSVLMLGLTKCSAMPYKPAVVVDADAQQLSDRSRSNGSHRVTIEQGDRGGLTYQQFGMIRERIAVWALQQTGNAKPGDSKYAIFTDAEHGALNARGAELKKLAPLFKGGTLGWSSWNDLTEW